MKKNYAPVAAPRPPLFGNLRVLVASALLIALSVVLGKYLAVSTPVFRFSLENLPILMAGIFFGPVIGAIVGVIADLIGCVLMSYTVNPLITLGAALIGGLSGSVIRLSTRGGRPLRAVWIGAAVSIAHIAGSMTVKTVGLALFAHVPLETLLWRIPLYVIIGGVECALLLLLVRNKLFMGQLSRLIVKKKGRKRMTNTMTYDEALAFIHSTSWKGSRPGLSRTVELCARLGDPQKSLRFVHVAGTNGKGSTSAMLASVLRTEGYRVGLYTSPFILRFNERMQVDGRDISDRELADIVALVRPHAEAMEDAPTEFELITAIAFVYFARQKCDIVVLEVGMGGRLDSTNIIDERCAIASVITGIAMDHTAFLGDMPEKIAAEKAGIVKAGVPVIFGGMHPDVGEDRIPARAETAARVIGAAAADQGAPYVEVDHRRLTVGRCDLFGAAFDFDDLKDLFIPLAGLYQPYNAATVLTVLKVLADRGFPVSETAIRKGLSDVRWPARFEVLCRDPLVIADGGHNPEGIDAAIASVRRYFGDDKIYLISGVMADKDYDHMVSRMATVAARVFCVRPGNDRALDPDRYAEAFSAAGVPAEGYATVDAGVRAGMEAAARDGVPLLCLGSLYMYGEVRSAVFKES